MKQILTRKQVIIRVFLATAIIPADWAKGLIFFCQGTFFEVLAGA